MANTDTEIDMWMIRENISMEYVAAIGLEGISTTKDGKRAMHFLSEEGAELQRAALQKYARSWKVNYVVIVSMASAVL